MKKIILSILLIGFLISPCFADLYVLIDKSTKEVKGICEKDTAQVEEGMEKIVLENVTINDLESLGYDKTTAYNNFEDGKFKRNQDKIDLEKQKIDKKNQDKQIAINKLKTIGNLTDEEIDTLIK